MKVFWHAAAFKGSRSEYCLFTVYIYNILPLIYPHVYAHVYCIYTHVYAQDLVNSIFIINCLHDRPAGFCIFRLFGLFAFFGLFGLFAFFGLFALFFCLHIFLFTYFFVYDFCLHIPWVGCALIHANLGQYHAHSGINDCSNTTHLYNSNVSW